MAELTPESLKTLFPEAVISARVFRGELTAVVQRERLLDVAKALRDHPDWRFNFLSDLTAVDHMPRRPRFDVVYHLCSVPSGRRLRLKVQIDEDTVVPSVTEVWPGANWYEREVFDLFGIRFEGHPNLTRILLPDDFEGHPLRRDHPVGKSKIPF